MTIPLWYQFYDVRKAGNNFWRFGLTPNLSSNRTDYEVANYTNSRTLIAYPGQTVTTTTEQAGLYDDGTSRRNKFFINYYAEFYRLPRRNFIPGYSVRLSSIRNAVFGDDTDRKLRFELGGILNILTAEKTKAIFTIQPYVAISSLNREMITDGDNKRQKTLAEKTSAGIRIGIPIQNQLALGLK